MPRSEPPRKDNPWDTAEDRYLLNLIDDEIGWPEIAANLKRPRGACMTRAGELLLAELLGADPVDGTLDSLAGAGRESSAWTVEEEGRLMAAAVAGKGWDAIALERQRQPTSCRTRAQVIALNQYLADLRAGTPTEAALRAASWRLVLP